MKPEKLQDYLQRLSRKDLEDLSQEVFGDRNASARNKKELVALLMEKPARVGRALGHQPRWWAVSSSHLYGVAGLVGTVLGLVTFFSPQPGETTRFSIDPLRKQEILDQVERLRSTTPAGMTEPNPARLFSDHTPEATRSGFELIEHSVVSDLRGFKPVASVDRGLMQSPVVQQIRQRIRKTDGSPAYLLTAHTSGIDVFCESPSHPLVVHASDERRRVASYPVKPRVLEFDVSSEPVGQEFVVRASKTYWNAFQNNDQSWVGIFVDLPTRSIRYLVLFPDDKPFTSFEHFVNDRDGQRIDLPEEEYVLQDPKRRWIWWNIVNPKPGHGYNIDWEW